MKATILCLVMVSISLNCLAQNSLQVEVKNEANEILPGATAHIKNTSIGAAANENGIVLLQNIPDGNHIIVISFIGFEEERIKLSFPESNGKSMVVQLHPSEEELEEVIITSTRISRSIENIPTRVEAISFEEIDEKTNMRPSNVSMLLHESTGIQVQQTSYSSATQTIRIQGLDGKYTQLLKDGFPNYSGFSSGLSILDIPPLDLQQVEVIKGSASTLYGGGAIAGVINFVTKQPKEKREINAIINQTSALGTDVGTFMSNRSEKVGFTFLGTAHYQKEYDVDDDNFTELPRQKEFTIFPKLFIYPDADTKIIIGSNFTASNRLGGDVFVIRDEEDLNHQYFEGNKSYRSNSYFTFNKQLSESRYLTVKQSFNFFTRDLNKPNYDFKGNQIIAFTDVSLSNVVGKHTFVWGSNFTFDQFKEGKGTDLLRRDQTQETISLYAQDNWDISQKVLVEGGFRLDYNTTYDFFALPRLSLLYKVTEHFSTRLGGGLGYKTPTLFVEETEARFFEKVLPLNPDLKAERSYGTNLDFNFTHDLGENVSISFNQLFFYTQLDRPLVLTDNGDATFELKNETDPIRTQGFETNFRFIADPFKLFVGYTFVDARALYKDGIKTVSLTPKSKVNMMLLLEEHGKYKLGLEGYFTDHQRLDDGRISPTFWEFGFFAEKIFNHISVFVNFENFTDVRQNKFEDVVLPPYNNPTFSQVYTHTEGFIVNGGIKLKL